MRFSTIAPVLCLCLSIAAAQAQAAQVLLPDDGDPSVPAPNLGITPKPQPQASPLPATPTQPNASAQDMKAPTQEELQKLMANPKIIKSGNVKIAPGGALPKNTLLPEEQMLNNMIGKGLIPQQRKLSPIDQQIKAIHDADAKSRERNPLFINELEPTELDTSKLPNAMLVAIAPTYMWGPGDVQIVSKRLGYELAEIPQNCQLRMDAKVVTDKEELLYSAQIMSGDQASVKYDGSVRAVTFTNRAICAPPRKPLPRQGGIITRSGDKLSIQLPSTSNCAVQARSSTGTSLEVQYLGDGAVKCVFR